MYWPNMLGLLTVNSLENCISLLRFFRLLHVFGTPNAAVTLLLLLRTDLTTIW